MPDLGVAVPTRPEILAVRRALASASHDLNGTLQALFTYLRVAQRQAPSATVDAAIEAAQRLKDEVAGVRECAEPAGDGRVDVEELARRGVSGVDPARVRVVSHGGDAVVLGHAGALARAIAALVRDVAAGLSDSQAVHVQVSTGEREVRVLVSDGEHDDAEAFDPLGRDVGARASLGQILAALVLEGHGGALLRGGAPGAWRFEAVMPRRSA